VSAQPEGRQFPQHSWKKRDNFLPFSPPLIGEEEIAEVVETLRSDWITTVEECGQDLAKSLMAGPTKVTSTRAQTESKGHRGRQILGRQPPSPQSRRARLGSLD